MHSENSGFIVIDKPEGISSARAIAQLNKIKKYKKIGHAGTLDPFATGILIVMVNRATKLARFVAAESKTYRALLRFGVATDTDDKTGKVVRVINHTPGIGQIRQILPDFTGIIQQKPPRYSAVKISGERAYKLARQNIDFDTTAKMVSIYSIQINSLSDSDLDFTVSCGSGTYIRSLARDLAAALGSCATLISLRREASSPFVIRDGSVCLVETLSDINIEYKTGELIPWYVLFRSSKRVPVSPEQAEALSRGDSRVVSQLETSGALPANMTAGDKVLFELQENGLILGILEYSGADWKLWAYIGR